jgi:hypothetical protein
MAETSISGIQVTFKTSWDLCVLILVLDLPWVPQKTEDLPKTDTHCLRGTGRNGKTAPIEIQTNAR